MQKWVLLAVISFSLLPLYAYTTKEGIRGFNNILSAKNGDAGRLTIALDLRGALAGERNENLWSTADIGLGVGFACNDWLSLNLFTRYMFDLLDSTGNENYISHGISDLEIGAKLIPFFKNTQNGGFAFAFLPSISIPTGTKQNENYSDGFLGALVGRGGRFRYFTTGAFDYGGTLLFSYTTRKEPPIEFDLNMGYFTHNKDRECDLISYGLGVGVNFRYLLPYVEISGLERIDKDMGPWVLYLGSGIKIGTKDGSHLNIAFDYRIDGQVETQTEKFVSSYVSTGERVTPSWSLNLTYARGFSLFKAPPQPSIIAGKTVDSETGEPIAATILLPDTAVQSDTVGNYFVETSPGDFQITVSKEGYLPQEQSLMLEAEQETTLCFELNKNPVCKSGFSGKFMDRITKEPIRAEIFFPETGIEPIATNERGEFSLNLEPDIYIVKVCADGYIPNSTPILLKEDETLCRDFYLLKIYENMTFQTIYFGKGATEIDTKQYPILNETLTILLEYPDIKVEIRGYTDNTGSAESNLVISQKRAQSVRDYFIKMGIEPSRLTAIGCGEDDPLASNDTEEGRAKNRRIEFLVVGVE